MYKKFRKFLELILKLRKKKWPHIEAKNSTIIIIISEG